MATRREKEKRKIRYTDTKKTIDKMDSGFVASIRLPKGVEGFAFRKAKKYKIDIMPYVVGKGNPNAPEGEVHWERTYYVHKGIGAEGKQHTCLRKTFAKKCPICEYVAKLRQNPATPPDLIKSLDSKRRQLFVVKDYGDPDKGFQVFETGYFMTFGELLKEKLDASTKYAKFFHLGKGGMTLTVSVVDTEFPTADGGSKSWNKPKNIEMDERAEDYDDDVLDEMPCLDECIVELPYDELKELFFETKDVQKGKGKKSKEDDDEDDADEEEEDDDDSDDDDDAGDEDDEDDDDTGEDEEEDEEEDEDESATADDLGIEVDSTIKHKKHGECTVVHVSGDGEVLRLKKGKKIIKGVPVSECKLVEPEDDDDDEDEEEEEKTPKKKKGKAKKEEEEEDDDEDNDDDEDEEEDDEEDEEEEEEETPKKKGKGKKPKDEEEDEDDEDWGDDDVPFDEDEEEEEEKPKKKGKKK
jgi:hypothetical protein